MSANIGVTKGRPSIAYYGDKPWHKLGTEVDHAMTSAEAITAAGLDWKVEKRPVQFLESDGTPKWIGDKFAIVRADTEDALGVVGPVYHPLQNKEAFSFFDAIVGEKLAMYHTAGALGRGEKIWLLAKLPSSCWITPEDNVEKFLLLANSHDGSSAINIMATPIRVVCQNTLNAALTEFGGEQRSRVRHTIGMGMKINDIRKEIGIADSFFKTFEQFGKHLVKTPATKAIVEGLLKELGFSKEKAEDSARTKNIREEIDRLFQFGKGNELRTVRGTCWALLNGVVEYTDHVRSSRGESSEEKLASRADSLLFGSGADMKQKAVDYLAAVTK